MRKAFRVTLQVFGGAVLFGTGAAVGAAGGSSPQVAPAAVVTVAPSPPVPVHAVAAPAVTKTVVKTVTRTAAPPPPAAGAVLGKFSGSGTQVTPPFSVPADGNFIVTWSYSGNTDASFGSAQPTNFAVTEAGPGLALGLPNDIAASGHGSTEVTGGSGTVRLNVKAAGSWTIAVTAA